MQMITRHSNASAALSNISPSRMYLWSMASGDVPISVEIRGAGINGLNIAACHACTLLPETTCEEGNRLLDRALLIGTSGNEQLGLFSDIHAKV